MHEKGHYSILVEKSLGKLYVPEELPRCLGEVKLIIDVPKGQPGWAVATRAEEYGKDYLTSLEFHLDSLDRLGGAGWNHGKFGQGQTDVVYLKPTSATAPASATNSPSNQ